MVRLGGTGDQALLSLSKKFLFLLLQKDKTKPKKIALTKSLGTVKNQTRKSKQTGTRLPQVTLVKFDNEIQHASEVPRPKPHALTIVATDAIGNLNPCYTPDAFKWLKS